MSGGQWFYLSFANDRGWLGGAYVPGNTAAEALISAWANDCNPGDDEVRFAGPFTAARLAAMGVPPEDRCRLLSLEELTQWAPDRRAGMLQGKLEVQPWR